MSTNFKGYELLTKNLKPIQSHFISSFLGLEYDRGYEGYYIIKPKSKDKYYAEYKYGGSTFRTICGHGVWDYIDEVFKCNPFAEILGSHISFCLDTWTDFKQCGARSDANGLFGLRIPLDRCSCDLRIKRLHIASSLAKDFSYEMDQRIKAKKNKENEKIKFKKVVNTPSTSCTPVSWTLPVVDIDDL